MLYFTIALRSKHSTSKWESVRADFESTLLSIFNQTCPDFQVYVGCSELPELKNRFDDRLHFVCVDTPLPKDWLDGCRDRAWKQLACCHAIRQNLGPEKIRGGVYVFPVDADDFVSNRIAEYVKTHPNEHGFKSPTGYRWYKGSQRLEISPYFGGSMNIIRLLPEEMPEEMPDISLCFDKPTCIRLNEKYPVRWNDIEVESKMALLGRPLHKLPFRTTIYVLNTGANISSNDPRNEGAKEKRLHLGVLLHKLNIFSWMPFSAKIKKEFGMER